MPPASAEALVTTAGGLIVAIPSLVAYRYFRGKVDGLVVDMEKESLKLVQAIDRTTGTRPQAAVMIAEAEAAAGEAAA
jgi:biopolymer transport protein ExbB/TolQ